MRKYASCSCGSTTLICFSVAGKLGIDIDTAIHRKMGINKGRSWKHENDKKGD